MSHAAPAFRYRWFAWGDVNGFFALAVDNLALLAGMSAILIGVFGMPQEMVFARMLPGTALGVLVGDLLYAAMALRLAHRERRQDVCAMPLGIDAPSMFALSFGVVGPAFVISHDAQRAWAIGMAVLLIMGIAKLIAAFFGDLVRRLLPATALLAAISAVAIALIMFLPFSKIMAEPVGGMVALGVVLLTLVGKVKLPWGIPAVVGSIVVGLCAYQAARLLGYVPPASAVSQASLGFAFPWPTVSFVDGLAQAWHFVPLALPVALATVVGGIDVTESAALAGDRYETRDVLLVEAVATIVAALCGGVIQNTPYIGHPAYKRMECRAAYTIATGLFIGIGAATGVIEVLIAWLPESVIVPILVYVGLEISGQAASAAGVKHTKVLALALVPTIAYLINIEVGAFAAGAGVQIATLPKDLQASLQAMTVLGNGFIVTAMLWVSWLVWVIDARLRAAGAIALAASAMTLFGLIHSPFANGSLFLPSAQTPQIVYALAGAYALVGLLCLALSVNQSGHGTEGASNGNKLSL